jgi:S1-C subfamily serine protease
MGKVAKLLLVIFIVLVLLLAAGLVYFFRSGAAAEAGIKILEPSSDLKVTVSVPPTIEAGTDFRLAVNVRNDGKAFLTIKEIILPGSILDQVKIIDVFPLPAGQTKYSGTTGFQENYGMAPGEVLDFVFTLHAVKAADLRGKVEVVADSFRGSANARFIVTVNDPYKPPPPESTPTWIPVANIPYQSVVQVTVMANKGGSLMPVWSGSGTVISTDGLILTSAHAVIPQKNYPVDALVVSISPQPNLPVSPTYFAMVVQADPDLDLAVILITADMLRNPVKRQSLHLSPVVIGDAEKLNKGDRINILGYPEPGDILVSSREALVDEISVDPTNNQPDIIHVSASVPGSYSGGLAANLAGELVGIPTAQRYRGENQAGTCRAIVDSNRDGVIDSQDSCVPTGNAINALRPAQLALPLIEAARRGDVNLIEHAPQIRVPVGTETLWQDDFSRPDSGWVVFDNEKGWGSYIDQDYRILVKKENTVLWSLAQKKFKNMVIQVKTTVQSPTGSGDWGMLCRYRDPENYYLFSVSEDGYFGIFKKANGKFSPLLDWSYSPAITWYTPLTLTVVCDGETLMLGVDGKILGQVTDNSLQEGDIGLETGSWAQPGFGVSFDDLEVKAP